MVVPVRALIKLLIEEISLERRLVSTLLDHFEDPMRPLPQGSIDELRSLRDNGHFRELLVPPKNVDLYRGLHAIPTDDLLKFVPRIDTRSNKDWVDFKIDTKFTSRSIASSWSTSKDIAHRFADGLVANTFKTANDPSDKFDIILIANTSNGEFLLNPENIEKLPAFKSFFEKLSRNANWVAMNEVIGIGDVPLQGVFYRASSVNISKTHSLALHVGYQDMYIDYEWDDGSEHSKGYTTEGWYVYRDGFGVKSGPFETQEADASMRSMKSS